MINELYLALLVVSTILAIVNIKEIWDSGELRTTITLTLFFRWIPSWFIIAFVIFTVIRLA